MRDDDTAPSRRETLQLMAAGALASAGAASMSEARAQGGPQIKPGNEDVFIVVDVQPGATWGRLG